MLVLQLWQAVQEEMQLFRSPKNPYLGKTFCLYYSRLYKELLTECEPLKTFGSAYGGQEVLLFNLP
jgi:hypothetical protein